MDSLDLIKFYFGDNLIKREVPLDDFNEINAEDLFLIRDFGIPNSNELSFIFSSPVKFLKEFYLLKIGLTNGNDPIIYDIKTREVYLRDPGFF